jgi:hypothetical protein
MLALKGRRFDDNTIYKQSQATLAEFKTQDLSKCFQHLRTASSHKGTTSKALTWNNS